MIPPLPIFFFPPTVFAPFFLSLSCFVAFRVLRPFGKCLRSQKKKEWGFPCVPKPFSPPLWPKQSCKSAHIPFRCCASLHSLTHLPTQCCHNYYEIGRIASLERLCFAENPPNGSWRHKDRIVKKNKTSPHFRHNLLTLNNSLHTITVMGVVQQKQ